MQWEVVIGLETHVQLSTQSKIFSGAPCHFGDAPNVHACYVDLALPGALPVLNTVLLSELFDSASLLGPRLLIIRFLIAKIIFIQICRRGIKSVSLSCQSYLVVS